MFYLEINFSFEHLFIIYIIYFIILLQIIKNYHFKNIFLYNIEYKFKFINLNNLAVIFIKQNKITKIYQLIND